jgi:hypothetical protein
MNREERGPWYLITGLIIGAALGVLYAWVVKPVEYTNTTPASLRADFKDQYRALIASAYVSDGDLVRARARLALLQDADVYRSLAEQAQRTLASGGAMPEARALGLLAVALGQPPASVASPVQASSSTPEVLVTSTLPPEVTPTGMITPTLAITSSGVSSPTLATPTITLQATRPAATPTSTRTPLPTRTYTPTPGSPFALKSEDLLCVPAGGSEQTGSENGGTQQPGSNATQPARSNATPTQGSAQGPGSPLIIVQTYDAAGQGVAGVEVVVNWDGGENRFFTGLKPELGLGYADFTMAPGVVYTLRLAEGGQIVPNLTPNECEASDGSRYWGSWLLTFQQP